MSVVTDMQQDKGMELAELLGLTKTHKATPDAEARYDLSTGSKTDLGLYLTVKRFIEEAEEAIKKEDEAVAAAMFEAHGERL
jgi:hypothetical protein